MIQGSCNPRNRSCHSLQHYQVISETSKTPIASTTPTPIHASGLPVILGACAPSTLVLLTALPVSVAATEARLAKSFAVTGIIIPQLAFAEAVLAGVFADSVIPWQNGKPGQKETFWWRISHSAWSKWLKAWTRVCSGDKAAKRGVLRWHTEWMSVPAPMQQDALSPLGITDPGQQ